MAQGKNITGLTELLLKCMAEPDPMLSMLEWLCTQLMAVVSDVNKGVIAVVRESFPGASWQRCKVHFMCNILAHMILLRSN